MIPNGPMVIHLIQDDFISDQVGDYSKISLTIMLLGHQYYYQPKDGYFTHRMRDLSAVWQCHVRLWRIQILPTLDLYSDEIFHTTIEQTVNISPIVGCLDHTHICVFDTEVSWLAKPFTAALSAKGAETLGTCPKI